MEYTGVLRFFKDICHASGCTVDVSVEDHKINKSLGILRLEVICGARKRDRKLVLLSQRAKEVIRRIMNNGEEEVVVKFIERVNKIPKIIIVNEKTNNVIAITVFGSGFRGDVELEGKDAKILYQASAGQAWGSVTIAIVYIKNNGYIEITRSGRLYGSPPEMILYNNEGNLVYVSKEEFTALQE